MKRTGTIIGFLLLWVALGVACGPEEPSQGVLQSELSTNVGEILISYAQPLGEPNEEQLEDSFRISARFVRIRDIERQDVRSLWSEELPLVEASIDECDVLEASSPRDQMLTGSLELLDAGELRLQVAGEEERIPNWNFPSVYGVVAGVLYGGDEGLGLGFVAEQEYRLVGGGSEEIGAIELAMLAPSELTGVVIGGVELGEDSVTLEASNSLDIRWEPSESGSEILIELSYAQFNSEQRLVCRSLDDGYLEVPSRSASRLWEAGVSDARLVIYRVLRRPFAVDGLEEAEAVFVVSLTIPLEMM